MQHMKARGYDRNPSTPEAQGVWVEGAGNVGTAFPIASARASDDSAVLLKALNAALAAAALAAAAGGDGNDKAPDLIPAPLNTPRKVACTVNHRGFHPAADQRQETGHLQRKNNTGKDPRTRQ